MPINGYLMLGENRVSEHESMHCPAGRGNFELGHPTVRHWCASHPAVLHLGDRKVGNKHYLDLSWNKREDHDRARIQNVALGRDLSCSRLNRLWHCGMAI